MRSYLTSAVLAAASVLAPAAAGYAPAWSQDFSITNKPDAVVTGDWTRQLQAWWDGHAWYPTDASDKHQDGTVKVHLTIHPDGQVWNVDVVQGSGWKLLDTAAIYAFHGGRLRPLPPAPRPAAT